MLRFTPVVFAALPFFAQPTFAAQDHEAMLHRIAEAELSVWSNDAKIIDAVLLQNERTAAFSQEKILAEDKQWRAETETGGPMISSMLANDLSAYLKGLKASGQGQFTEIFVTDIKGLNVGQSDVTSDVWQGDEDKWQVPMATNSIHFGDIEFDESTQTYQSQVSLPITANDQIIGVITVGINLEEY